MTHWLALVLVEPDTTDIEDRVALLLEPFYEERDVPEYKVHIYDEVDSAGWNQLRVMAAHYDTEPADLHGLARHMEHWNDRRGGVDGEGLFYWTTRNPHGHWDWYEIGGRWDGWLTAGKLDYPMGRNACRVRDMPTLKPPGKLLTPDGEWHEHRTWNDRQGRYIEHRCWDGHYYETLSAFPGHIAVCVDLHT